MTAMLDRMAKAAWADLIGLDERLRLWREDGSDPETNPDTWPNTLLSADADAFRSAARAALLAIREPSEMMMRATLHSSGYGDPEDFTAIIDAILAGEPE